MNAPTRLNNEEARWLAVQSRNQQADGLFFYGVKTTGVFCRPSCGSRQAKRENVVFFNDAVGAREAGFRPCKRCRPEDTQHGHAATIAAACRLIENSETAPDLDALAGEIGLSKFYFHRLFKQHTGLTPKAYAKAQRAQKIREALPRQASVTEAIYEAGFNSSSRFYADAKTMLGMQPKAYRDGGAAMQIRFALGQSSLGAILVAATDQGVCAVLMDDDPEALLQDLQDRFPKAALIGADPEFERWMAQVVGLVEKPGSNLKLPLDVQGTTFQQQVWQALREIPPGSTATYSDIAQKIGLPKAVRAVAQACAANKIAVAIPCHRVVRSDGSLSGYRWGVERKRELLEREKS